jgi:hypothetical protein
MRKEVRQLEGVGWIFLGIALVCDGEKRAPIHLRGWGPLLWCPSAHRRPGYPLVGLRPRRARLRFTRCAERSRKRSNGASPAVVRIGKSNCRWPLPCREGHREV